MGQVLRSWPKVAQGLRVLAFSGSLVSAGMASLAEPVRVSSPDGAITLSGDVLGFDGVLLRLSTEYGPISVDITEVVCEGPACPSVEDHIPGVRLSGAPAVGRILLPALIDAYASRNELTTTRVDIAPDRFRIELAQDPTGAAAGRFDIHLTSTEEGFADLVAEEADLVMAVREPRAEEAARAFMAGAGDLTGPGRAHVLALDAVVPVVSPANPQRGASLRGLSDLWSSPEPSWTDIGGDPGQAALHAPPALDGFSQLFTDRVLTPFGAVRSGLETLHAERAVVPTVVARDIGAIGLVRFTDLGNAQPIELVGACGRRMSVTVESLKAEDYPLTAPLMLYVPARRQPAFLHAFFDWLDSPAAELVVRRVGLIDQVPMEIPIARQGERLANAIVAVGEEVPVSALQRAVRQLDGARRLTTTFRFRGGSARLDPLSEDNLDRLARDLDAGLYAKREVILAGFSDGVGPVSANREISLARANAVRDALAEAVADPDTLDLVALGFGEVLPLACDDTDWGRQANRRVEVWVR